MPKLIVGALLLATSSAGMAENWMAEPINTNVEGKRAVPLIDRDGIIRTNPAKPFAMHGILYEQPEGRTVQRVWVTQFDCAARTFRMTSEETRDINDNVIDWKQMNMGAIAVTRYSIHEDFLEAACNDKWAPRLRAMGKLSNKDLSKALFGG